MLCFEKHLDNIIVFYFKFDGICRILFFLLRLNAVSLFEVPCSEIILQLMAAMPAAITFNGHNMVVLFYDLDTCLDIICFCSYGHGLGLIIIKFEEL